MEKYCLMTNDVETHSIWFNCLKDEIGKKVLIEGMPILLEMYERFHIKSTFFFTGNIAKRFPEIVKMILPYGHEVACHGLSHEMDETYDILNYNQQQEKLTIAKAILEDISGNKVISFRAPALRVNQYTPIALADVGFKIDSSVSSQRLDMFFSLGCRKKLNWITAPRFPYLTRFNNLFRLGDGPIIEVPISAFIVPYIGTTLRIIPKITKIFRFILHIESNVNQKPIVFDIHPNEFLEERGKRMINRRATNALSCLLADIIRSKLKTKNLGKKAIPLFLDEIKFFKHHKYKFYTISEYCRKLGYGV